MQNRTDTSAQDELHLWYNSSLGQLLVQQIQQALQPVLDRCFGYFAVQIGDGHVDAELLQAARVRHVFTLDQQLADICANSDSLPIATDSLDLVLLWHSLSGHADPHALLREADRVLIPAGKLILVDFNPFSLWGLRRLLQFHPSGPWRGQYFSRRRLHDWLKLLGFEGYCNQSIYYGLPRRRGALTSPRWEALMRRLLPGFGALNIMVYEKRMTPITPYRHNRLSTRLLPAGIAKPSMGRQSKP